MSRKWTNIKFKLKDRNGAVREPSADPRTQEEELFDYITDRWDEENLGPPKNIDVMFGNLSTDKLSSYMEDIFSNVPYVKRAGAVFVTDSAHVGYGFVFERSDDGVSLVAEYNGAEGAMGHDVAEEISDEHYVNVDPNWFW